MMKIVTFSEKFWPEGSGGELATYLILKLLASIKDFEIEIYTGTEEPMPIPGALVKVVEFLRASNKVQLFLNILRNRQIIEKVIEKADIVYIPRFSYPIIQLAKKYNKKVIAHLHDYQPVSYTAVILSTEVDKPLSDFKRTFILESRSSNTLRALVSSLATPLTRVIRRWVGMADKIICVSQRHKEILLKFAPEYREKTIVVYNPPPEVLNIDKEFSRKPTLLYVGGDSYVKGFHILLEALRILVREKRTNFDLLLANRYSQKSMKIIEQLKRRHDLNVQVLGRINHKALMEVHSHTWALLFPSICEEPLPYVIVESLVVGTLPLASRVGGVVEIVKNTVANDFLFSPNNIYEFVNKIERIVSMDKWQIYELSLKLRQDALTRLNTEDLAKKLMKVFL